MRRYHWLSRAASGDGTAIGLVGAMAVCFSPANQIWRKIVSSNVGRTIDRELDRPAARFIVVVDSMFDAGNHDEFLRSSARPSDGLAPRSVVSGRLSIM